MTTSASLYAACSELLTKAGAILAATPAGAPQFRFVSHGAPPYDCCSLLTVHAGIIQYGAFNRGAMGTTIIDPKMPVVPMVPLTITALRCQSAIPKGGIQITLPQAAQMDKDAADVMADGWSLFCGINKAYRDGSLFSGYSCRPFEVDQALPVAPEGGCLGWALTVHVELDGFDPAGA